MSFHKFASASSKKKKFTNFDLPRPSGSVIGPPRKQTSNDADDSNPNSFKTDGIGDLAGKLGNVALGSGASTGFDKFKKKRSSAAGAAY